MTTSGLNSISVRELIEKKANPNSEFSLEEKVSLINGCILMGSRETKKYESDLKKGPIVFIGNTGAGKSTLINYLAGCTLQFIDRDKFGMPDDIEDCIIVRADSRQKEVTKIGLTKASETLIHKIASVNGRVFVDCPGFADNRGVELNVANVTNVSNMLCASEKTKIILVQNYSSLLGDRARGLSEVVKTVEGLFGGVAKFLENQSSVLLGVTKVPNRVDGKQEKLRVLEKVVRSVNDAQLNHEARQILDALSDNLFIYHPTDEIANMHLEGGLTRDEILQKIDDASEIKNPGEVFKVPLDVRDEHGLQNICEEMAGVISNALQQGKHERANQLLQHTYLLRKIEHSSVSRFIEICRSAVVVHFKEQVQLLSVELVDNPEKLTERASSLLHTISLGVSAFGEEELAYLETETGLNAIKESVGAHQKRVTFLTEEGKIRAMTNDFLGKCSAFDFGGAQKLFEEISEKVNNLCTEFKDEGVSEKFDLSFFKNQLEKSKEQQKKLEQTSKEMAEIKQQLNEKITQMQTANDEERKKMMEDKKKLENQISAKAKEVESSISDTDSNGELMGAIGTIGKIAFTAFFGQFF